MKSTQPVHLNDPQVSRCPFPVYEILREQAPVYQDPATGHYVLTRYADVRQVLMSPKVFSNQTGLSGAARKAPRFCEYMAEHGWPLVETLQNTDPPEHTLHRRLVQRAFSAPAIEALKPRILELVDGLLDQIIGRGETELVAAYALPLPLRTTTELLGFEQADEAALMRWAHALVELTAATLSEERELALAAQLVEMQRFFVANVERVRESGEDTIIARLVHAAHEDDVALPTVLNIISQLITGHHSIAAGLSLGVKRLAERQDIAARLRAEPGLIANFVEEVLRLEAPIQVLYRRALQDVEIGEVKIAAGAIVQVRYGSANRDPRMFAAADDLDLGREKPMTHLAFGIGPHVCIGNQLVRSELRLSFERVLQRARAIRLTRGSSSAIDEAIYVTYGRAALDCPIDGSL
ncbi:MAG: cytochrome P450, partial [Steroidobacteraceae bacterium]